MEKHSKSLKELGIEYEKNAKMQQFFIDRCKKDIEKAKKEKDREAVRELKSNLLIFYKIKRELTEVSDTLKNYYEK